MGLSTDKLFREITAGKKSGTVSLEGEMLRRYQMQLLKIAEDFVDACEKSGALYCLVGGSCLGAVRHQGFIPWDDDVDMNVLAEDYDRFLKTFTELYGDKYEIVQPGARNYSYTFTKIRLKGSTIRAFGDDQTDECGFFIDVNKIESVPDSRLLRTLQGGMCMAAGLVLSCRRYFANRKLIMSLAKSNAEAERTFRIKIILGGLAAFLPIHVWARAADWCNGLCRNSRSRDICIPSGRKHYFGEIYRRDTFTHTVDCQFEGHTWKVPGDTEGYLTHMYGDYMAIPPEEDRETHYLLELKFPGET